VIGNRRFLIAIRPHNASRIWACTKPYEFRRRSINLSTGDVAFVYETRPVCTVTGTFSVGRVLHGVPGVIARLEPNLDEQRAVLQYLSGTPIATAMEIVDPQLQAVSLPLELLGLRQPPQSYQFLSELQVERLGLIG
jgi:predicted transcriptional regulator